MFEQVHGIEELGVKGFKYEELFIVENTKDTDLQKDRVLNFFNEEVTLLCADLRLNELDTIEGARIFTHKGDLERFEYKDKRMYLQFSDVFRSEEYFYIEVLWTVTSRFCGSYIYRFKVFEGELIFVDKKLSVLC